MSLTSARPLLDEAPEVVGRDGLAARDAVQVGRLEAHQLDRRARAAAARSRRDRRVTGREYATATAALRPASARGSPPRRRRRRARGRGGRRGRSPPAWPGLRSSAGSRHQRPSSRPWRRSTSWQPAMTPCERVRDVEEGGVAVGDRAVEREQVGRHGRRGRARRGSARGSRRPSASTPTSGRAGRRRSAARPPRCGTAR